MIGPGKVTEAIIGRVKKNKAALGVTNIKEIYEDFADTMRAPYLTIHSDFEQDADFNASGGRVIAVPVEIKLTVFSSAKKTPGLTFESALDIAIKTLRLTEGVYTIDDRPVRVAARSKPLEIWAKKSDQAILMLNLFYMEEVL